MALHHPGTRSLLDSNVGVSDACLLEPLTERNFIDNLHQRFQHHQIYTYIGSVVVSVNPYQRLPLYTQDVIFEYRSRNIYEVPPHIYAIADGAYRSMRDRNKDQCVIISGESGSGKTEASKVIMQYVAAVSGKGQQINSVKEQLLQSNPVLEAFGNAKTLRNDNSSRFGKYMDIEFDYKGDPVGGVITNYLLEKSRVVLQSKGERSFHIFYQLLSGADTSFLKSLKLQRNPDHYSFLNSSGCVAADGVDDRDQFQVTKKATDVIGFSAQELVAVFQLVACILKLGNIQFQHRNNIDGTDGCRLVNEEEVYDVCDLFQCNKDNVLRALKQRSVETGGDRVRRDLSATEAYYARDALCKAIYSRLFTWLVNRINDSIKVKFRGRRKSLGVLDIYGFEILENNSFEQFIINYCNEKLQQIFIELTLKEEQEEYISEGIQWIHVDYFNNAVICELIEKTNVGILAMLDEECLRPGKVTDETFLNKLNQLCSSHPHYEGRKCKKCQNDKTLPYDAFRLQHYAGAVTYKVSGFVDKNNDTLYRDLSRAMYRCNHPLLRTLFPEGSPDRQCFRRPATAGTQFKVSIGELMKNLLSKSPNYIRCIKPNDMKSPRMFDDKLVEHQVRYLGLIENVRVRRAGYAFRQVYDAFLYRYKMLALSTWPNWYGRPEDGVTEILLAQGIREDEYAKGCTKLFIRNPQTLFMLEEGRRQRMHYLATLLQKMYRGWRDRVRYRILRWAQIIISSHLKAYQARKKFVRMRLAALTICAFYKGWQILIQNRLEALQLSFGYFECSCSDSQNQTLKELNFIIRREARSPQEATARKLLARMRYKKRCIWAVGIICKYFHGWQVRKEYRKKFKAIAGPKIVRFLVHALKTRFLIELAKKLPSMSPTDRRWPQCSPMYRQLSEELRRIHHRWRCERYRCKFDHQLRSRMREKVTASDIFRDKKSNYPRSVPHPFIGDYVRLRQNTKWKRISLETNDQQLIFADIVMKINRKNGKMVPQLLVLSINALLVLDQRTLAIKYRIPVSEIQSMSLSPYHDRLVVIHILKHENNGDILAKKGDLVLSSDHVIEIVAKTYMVIQNATGKKPDVHISACFGAEFNTLPVEFSFKPGSPDVPPGLVKITRKNNNFIVLMS